MLSVVPVVCRAERMLAQKGNRLFSTNVPKTPEQIKQAIEKTERLAKFMQRPANTRMARAVGSGADLHVPKNIAEMAALSGMPADHAARTVIIAPRQFKSVQSGQAFAHQWQITWKNADRWKNPLMGWVSSADPMAQVKLNFDNREEAVAFAERNGWAYQLQLDTSKSNRPLGFNSYKDNFLDKRTVKVLKKEGFKNQVYTNPGYGKSNYFMPLKYHGDGEVLQHGPTAGRT